MDSAMVALTGVWEDVLGCSLEGRMRENDPPKSVPAAPSFFDVPFWKIGHPIGPPRRENTNDEELVFVKKNKTLAHLRASKYRGGGGARRAIEKCCPDGPRQREQKRYQKTRVKSI